MYESFMGIDINDLTSAELKNSIETNVDMCILAVVRLLETEPSDEASVLHTKLQEAKSIIQRINT